MPFGIIRNPARPDDDFKAQQKLEFDRWRKDVRVKVSPEATLHYGLNAKRRNRRQRIEGTIISPSPVEQIVTILWDGWTKTESWHLDLLEKIPAA